jgi:hypothetical protein
MVLKLIQKLQAISVNDVATESLEAATDQLRDRQKDQLLSGLNSKGQKIGRYQSKKYASFKNQMNPAPGFGVPDLRLTGGFYKGIYSDVRGETVLIDSTDEKTTALVKKYGESVFGLNKPTKREFIKQDLRPIFMRIIRAKTGL